MRSLTFIRLHADHHDVRVRENYRSIPLVYAYWGYSPILTGVVSQPCRHISAL